MRSSVVFPAPFGPTTPTRSPAASPSDSSEKSGAAPYALVTFWMERRVIAQE
jgi:hypothetical protein